MRRTGLVAVVAAALWAGACATGGGTPRPFPTPGHPAGPDPAIVTPPSLPGRVRVPDTGTRIDGGALTSTALGLRGIRYQWGGSDLNGFDCSGFTQYVFGRHGVALPRETRDQFRAGRTVRRADVLPGDLLFFTTTAPGPTHVAIALGDGEFVHSPNSTGVVRVEHLSSRYWTERFIGARRVD